MISTSTLVDLDSEAKMTFSEQDFKSQYIAAFLGAYMAGRYDSDCMNGHPNNPYDNQPVEDAKFLADCAWDQLKALE